MSLESENRRAALENERPPPHPTKTEDIPPWEIRQTVLDSFVAWLSAWRELMCSHDFTSEKQPL